MMPYQQFYSDATRDPFEGQYGAAMAEYAVGANQPAALRAKVAGLGNRGNAVCHLVLARQPNAAATDPGTILCYHRFTRYEAGLGEQTPYDGNCLSFFGDMIDGQVPPLVLLPDDLFNTAGSTQVPTSAQLDLLLAQDTSLELVGPFQATDPDTEAISVRRIAFLPHKYVPLVLGQAFTPRVLWATLRGAIVNGGDELSCAELINWMRVAITRRAAGEASRVAVEPLREPLIQLPTHGNQLQRYKLGLVRGDLPGLQTGGNSVDLQAVASEIANLAAVQREQGEEERNRRRRENTKSPTEFYGVQLPLLLQYSQVGTQEELTSFHTQVSRAPKGEQRRILQAEIKAVAGPSLLDYDIVFYPSPALTAKVLDLTWYADLPDDFTSGINIFNLGAVSAGLAEQQRREGAEADTVMMGTTAASVADSRTINDSSKDVCIPHSLADLRYQLERFIALWYVILPTHHGLVQQLIKYRALLLKKERLALRAAPKLPSELALVPFHLARRLQLDINFWFKRQRDTSAIVPVPDLGVVFDEIELDKDWSRRLPPQYLQKPPSSIAGGPSVGGSSVSVLTTPPGLTASSTSGSSVRNPSSDRPGGGERSDPNNSQAPDRNPNYDDTRFGTLRAKAALEGIRARRVRERCQQATPPITLPKNDDGTTMCLSYHLLGMCNTRCGLKADHDRFRDGRTSAGELDRLKTWADQHWTS
jgi:hypothetical protein